MNENTEKKNSKAKQNYTKSGKLAKRRECRRMEAIARQVANVQKAEANAAKAKDKSKAEAKVNHANFTLQTIRGGVPHTDLAKKFGVSLPEVKAE